jgi:hypothetical protein
MATQAGSDQNAARVEKDPLASHLIPEMIEDRKYESEGRVLSYRRGKLLGKVQTTLRNQPNFTCNPSRYAGWFRQGVRYDIVAEQGTICYKDRCKV